MIGKGTHEMIWTLLFTYINKTLPSSLHVFTTANSQILSIFLCALMPYYKYIMEYLNFNSFFLLGIVSIFTGILTNKFVELDVR